MKHNQHKGKKRLITKKSLDMYISFFLLVRVPVLAFNLFNFKGKRSSIAIQFKTLNGFACMSLLPLIFKICHLFLSPVAACQV